MKIRVDWFKPSGKWYAGGEVEIGDLYLFDDELKQAIVDNQNHIGEGWQGYYDVVTSDTEENWRDESYTKFFKHLFHSGKFLGIKRKNT